MKAFQLAWLNVLRNRRRSLVTILIATLGSAALLIAGGFALYTYDSLREAAARDSGHLTLSHPDYFNREEETPMELGMADYHQLSQQLETDQRVRQVLPRLNLTGLISNGDKSTIFMGIGANFLAEAAIRGPFLQVLSGQLSSGESPRGLPRVLLGDELAKNLHAKPGSGLTLLVTTTSGGMNAIDVEVAATISTGWREVDKRLVYTDIATAQRLLVTDKVSTLAVFLDDTSDTPAVLADWQGKDQAHGYKPWWEQAFYYRSVRDLYNRIFGLLGLIIAALVFFSVSNTLTMAVVERTREVGTLRAIGALPGEIVAGFVREGTLIGAIGTVLGMLLAAIATVALLVLDVQMPPPPGRSDGYPLRIYADAQLYLLAAAAIVLLCAVAAWAASRKAANKPIVEALGHV